MKKALTILTAAGTYLTLTGTALAASVKICPPAPFNILCDKTAEGTFVQDLINLLFVIAIIIAVVYLIWGGIKWIMSGGDKTALQTAREHVIAAIVGLVVVFLAYFILNFVLRFFGLASVSSSNAGLFSF